MSLVPLILFESSKNVAALFWWEGNVFHRIVYFAGFFFRKVRYFKLGWLCRLNMTFGKIVFWSENFRAGKPRVYCALKRAVKIW